MKTKRKLLVVDDDPGLQEMFKIILNHAGYDVEIISNGNKIFSKEFNIPDLFLVDKQLSGIDGLDICRFLKRDETTKNIPLLMVSANPDIQELSIRAGADGYIQKPFQLAEFLHKIKETIF